MYRSKTLNHVRHVLDDYARQQGKPAGCESDPGAYWAVISHRDLAADCGLTVDVLRAALVVMTADDVLHDSDPTPMRNPRRTRGAALHVVWPERDDAQQTSAAGGAS